MGGWENGEVTHVEWCLEAVRETSVAVRETDLVHCIRHSDVADTALPATRLAMTRTTHTQMWTRLHFSSGDTKPGTLPRASFLSHSPNVFLVSDCFYDRSAELCL